MITPDTSNPMLQLAHDFVHFTNEHVFLTGKAGTGKTTFLKQLRLSCPKQHAVLAPTGVAAINAGGTTIHSFFQLPFTPFVPGNQVVASDEATEKHRLLGRLRFNREKRELLQSLDLLIIDEVSMVRCDVIDAIDVILRHVRESHKPFGGVQMLFIGDMYQLPPVVQEQEWSILSDFYNGPFFFNSQVIQQYPPVYIELQTIYRQSDAQFIDLLNEVRNNQLTQHGLSLLNSRYQPEFEPPSGINYITLTTHNKKADAINENALNVLQGLAQSYKAAVEGEFSERNFPAEETLQLKVGAQVMFLKNDLQEKRYYNGKIGVVAALSDDEIEVQCPGENEPIKVKPDTWRNVQYTLNRQLQQVEEKEVGSFTQFPLRLAWAVTIHKSQGLTFEHAIIDAASSFSAGQVYVALSRCKSLEGMVLLSKVPQSAVMVDNRVQQFAAGAKPQTALQQTFAISRNRFQQQLLLQAYDGMPLQKAIGKLEKVLQEHPESFGDKAIPWMTALARQCNELGETAARFQRQLQEQMKDDTGQLEENTWVQGRVQKAASWFDIQLTAVLSDISKHPAVSDSQEHAMEFEVALGKVLAAAKQWQQFIVACQHGFDTATLLRAKSKVNISEVTGTAYAGSSKRRQIHEDSPHPVLLSKLKKLRDALCESNRKPIYMVASTTTLHELAMYLPQNKEELLLINGFGPQKVEQFGEAFLHEIVGYCEANGLESQVMHKVPKRQRKQRTKLESDSTEEKKLHTRDVSYALWQQGKSVAEIAGERNLQPSTIEGHLGHFVLSGLIPMEFLIHTALYQKIEEVAIELQTPKLGPIKSILGDDASFGQIRLVVQCLQKEGRLQIGEEAVSIPED